MVIRVLSKEEVKRGIGLAGSMRGAYLIGQALAIAARLLRAANHPRKELSNADDMELIGLSKFAPFYILEGSNPFPELDALEGRDQSEKV